MKTMWKEIGLALFMGMILPAILVGIGTKVILGGEETRQETQPPYIQTDSTRPLQKVDITIRLRTPEGEAVDMDMDAYLVGVVCGEMPATFEMEALKAQAVVARTYTLKALRTGGKHGDGSVCTDYACCQAYVNAQRYLELGWTQEDLDKVSAAVMATSGYVLTYQGSLIEATYFSCSGGRTEDAVAVWGTDFPYLRSTDSPGEEDAAHYTDTVYFTKAELSAALGCSLSGAPEQWVGYTTYTAGGGVNTMVIGGKEYRGTQLRQLLGLKSTAFTITPDSKGVSIQTRGYGHRVGMSQYGADAMAAGGSDYAQILAYYYPGTSLELTKGDS